MNLAAKLVLGLTAAVIVLLIITFMPFASVVSNLSSGGEDTAGVGMSVSDVEPDALPSTKAQLVVQGTRIPISLRRVKHGTDVTLDIAAHDEPYESEVYRQTSDSYALVSAADETFAPPIDVLRFPLRIGSSWDWSGTMGFGGARKATAKIVTSSDKLFVDAVPLSTIKVTVNLSIDANPPDGPMVKRDLTFWFSPGNGVVRRDFGAGSVREPLQNP